MPELSRFFKIIVKMYFDDTKKHHKPHIHVFYNEFEALIGLDGELLEGSLPIKELKLVEAWIVIHEDELYCDWNKAVKKEPLEKIEPLQ
jgi:hypothetical protein